MGLALPGIFYGKRQVGLWWMFIQMRDGYLLMKTSWNLCGTLMGTDGKDVDGWSSGV